MGIMVFPLLLHGNGDSSRDGDQVYGNAVGAGRFVAVVPRSWSSNFQCIQHHTDVIETYRIRCVTDVSNIPRLTALFPGLPWWASTRKVKPIWILLEQETVSGSGISWVICKSAPRCRQIITPAPHRLVFYRPDALPATQPTASKH